MRGACGASRSPRFHATAAAMIAATPTIMPAPRNVSRKGTNRSSFVLHAVSAYYLCRSNPFLDLYQKPGSRGGLDFPSFAMEKSTHADDRARHLRSSRPQRTGTDDAADSRQSVSAAFPRRDHADRSLHHLGNHGGRLRSPRKISAPCRRTDEHHTQQRGHLNVRRTARKTNLVERTHRKSRIDLDRYRVPVGRVHVRLHDRMAFHRRAEP